MNPLRHRIHCELRSVEGRRLSLEETLKAVAIPPVVYEKATRVEHFLAKVTGKPAVVVTETLELPRSFIEELIRFGAVYSAPVIPDTAPVIRSLPTDLKNELKSIQAKAIERVGHHPSHRQPRRVGHDDIIHQDSYCRVHVHPKRFPAYYQYDWNRRILMENAHCIVVDKPCGCQVPPRVDNQLECLVNWVQKHQRLTEGLKPVHRLDTGTEGLVVLAKTREFARFFQRLINGQGGTAEKGYRALTRRPPPLGPLRHYMILNHHVKGLPRRSLIYDETKEGAVLAELVIHETSCVSLSAAAKERWGIEEAFESMIELKTGRTHQIRVQLAHVGAPLLGDGLYGDEGVPGGGDRWNTTHDASLGLQAATLRLSSPDLGRLFQGIIFEATAGDPWWRTG